MKLEWAESKLKIAGVNSLKEVFEEKDIKILHNYEDSKGVKLFTNERFLLADPPIFINDEERKPQIYSIESSFKYYVTKLEKSLETDHVFYVFPYDESEKKFKGKKLNYDFPNVLSEVIEEINMAGVSRKNMKLNPMFLNNLYQVYSCESSSEIYYLFNLRNLFAAFFLSDKFKVENSKIVISFHNSSENKYNNLNLNWVNLEVDETFYNILEWVFYSINDKSVFELRLKVAKIYLANLGAINNLSEDKTEVVNNLSATYDLVLSKEAKNFYEYQNMVNDEFFKLLQQKNKIINEKNKSSLNIIISFPIALYGVYLTAFRQEESFTLISNQYNFVYIIFLIACIFMLSTIKYEIGLLNRTNEQILNTIQNTYNVNIERWKKKTEIIWWKDFRFPLVVLGLIFFSILVLLLLSNFNFVMKLLIRYIVLIVSLIL